MKRIIILSILLHFLLALNTYSQETRFNIYPEASMKYIYKITELNYDQNKRGITIDSLIKTKIISIRCDNFQSEKEKYLLVKVLENTVEKPESNIINFKDYRFPEFRDGFYDTRFPDFYEELFCRIDFKYDFKIETGDVNLLNREEVLLDVRSILGEKGFGKEEINKRTTIFNQEAIPQITNYLKSIYQVSAEFPEGQSSFVSKYDGKMEIRDSIVTLKQKKWDIEPGLYMQNFSIDNAKKCLLNLSSIELDSLKRPRKIRNVSYEFSVVEKQIQLKNAEVIGLNRFIISGKVENPKSKTVTLAVLKNPYGVEVHLETIYLDENNSFQFDIEINHAGIIYLQFGKNNFYDKRAILSFYAEPGSKIYFEAKGEDQDWDLEITGKNAGASKLLYDLRKNHKIFDQRIDWNTVVDLRQNIGDENFMNTFKGFDNIAEKYRNEMDENAFHFITNEITAYFLDRFYDYLSRIYYAKNSQFGTLYYGEQEKIDTSKLEELLNSYNILKIYNNYGIHSRILLRDYLKYNFISLSKVKEYRYQNYKVAGVNADFYFNTDISQKVELARAVLTGHPLYCQLTEIFLSEIRKEERMLTQDKSYILKQIDNYFDLMIRVCNDNEFVNAIKEIRKNNLQWQNENHIPEAKFFNEKGEPKYFKDFLGEKPTVFYISYQWDRERYYWDKLAEDNPELSVVMVMSGSNFLEWTKYIEAATPIAKQLFLVDTDLKLTDIFLNNSRHFLAYDKNGLLIGINEDADKIVRIAKQSLEPKKKELNKSQLKIIILALGILILIATVVFAIWKWRVRQRFRKEAQIRKLRELELTAIRSQMNPHFLFNCLNSVQNLVQQNKGREAHLYLSDFAGLIRKVLQNSEKEEVSLAEELEMTEQYLNLEKLRFDFDFSIGVEQGIDIHNSTVPSMLLQPFAENAVIHGLQNKPEDRRLKIEVVKRGRGKGEDKGIVISIEDNGIGREAAAAILKVKNGKGSKLIQERLEILQEKQGEKYSLNTIDLEEGTRVEIFIPEEK